MGQITATLWEIVVVRCDDCPRVLARITVREDESAALHGTMVQVLRDHCRVHERGVYDASCYTEFTGTYAELLAHQIPSDA